MRRTSWRGLAVILTMVIVTLAACGPNLNRERPRSGTGSSGSKTTREADIRLIPAAEQGDAETIRRLLVDAGADVDIASREEVTPLEHARRRGYDEIAGILEDAGAR